MYYRPSPDDNQYAYPLDFCPIYDIAKKEVIHIDVPKQRVPVSKAPPTNWHAEAIEKDGGFREPLKPINITQPEGPSFTLEGRVLSWQNWKFHVGFNYREGIVLSNVTFNDKGNVRPVSIGRRSHSSIPNNARYSGESVWQKWWSPTDTPAIRIIGNTLSTWENMEPDT